jgi:hypothetical protein
MMMDISGGRDQKITVNSTPQDVTIFPTEHKPDCKCVCSFEHKAFRSSSYKGSVFFLSTHFLLKVVAIELKSGDQYGIQST